MKRPQRTLLITITRRGRFQGRRFGSPQREAPEGRRQKVTKLGGQITRRFVVFCVFCRGVNLALSIAKIAVATLWRNGGREAGGGTLPAFGLENSKILDVKQTGDRVVVGAVAGAVQMFCLQRTCPGMAVY